MLKDDRMMGLMTFLVVMVAIGTVIQRADLFDRFLGGGGITLQLQSDEAIVRANALTSIDVLANDQGLKDSDAEKLIIARQPSCGRAFVEKGHIQYLPAERCVGQQSFAYALSERSQEQVGEVRVIVRAADPGPGGIAADAQRDLPAPAPMAPRATERRIAGTAGQSLQLQQPSEAAGTVSRAPAAPRPQAPASIPQPGASAPGAVAGGGNPALAGISRDLDLAPPRLTIPAGGLGTSGTAATALQPTGSVPAELGPLPQGSDAPVAPSEAASPTAATGTMTTEPAAPRAPTLAPTTEVPLRPRAAEQPGTATSPVSPPVSAPAAPADGRGQQAIDVDTPGDTPERALGAATETNATIALARIGTEEDRAASRISQDDAAADTSLPRQTAPQIGSGGTALPGLQAPGSVNPGGGSPTEVLAAVRALGSGSELPARDTAPPPQPGFAPGGLPGGVPADVPGGASTGTGQQGDQQPPGAAGRVASLPAASAACTLPPALILDVKPAGITEVILDAPCQAGTVAELSYEGLSFGVALDGKGAGSVAAIGLQRASDATVRFADGESMAFNIPFNDTERMDRVVLAWEMPVEMTLHAFEFGAGPESAGHVSAAQPRSFAEVRRHGGGYLLEYRPVGDIGHRIAVYSFWRRQGGPSGVVKLKLDFASRTGQQRPDTCGTGARAEPGFVVLRSLGGILERPHRRSLAALDCAAVAAMQDRYIGDAVEDLIVRRQ